jgi:hypothetical protein
MGLSTGRDLHIDRMLTNIAINFRPTGMIADMVAPIVIVEKERDLYPIFSQAEMFAIEDSLRSRGTEAKKITRSVSSASYDVKNYALARDLPIEDIANMDASIQFELGLGATHHILDMLRLSWEQRTLNTVSSASNVSTVFVPASAWNAAGTTAGDPVSQIQQVIEQMQGTTGYKPNSILIGWRAWAFLRRNANVRNLINGTNNGKGFVTRQQVTDLFEVERFLVQESFFNTANEAQSMSLTSPFHDKVLVYYAPTAPSRETPSFMYTFRWQNPALPAPLVIERHPYDSRKKIETIEAGYYQDEKVTGTAFAALLSGVGSAQSNGIA